jgi:hypothetical protein
MTILNPFIAGMERHGIATVRLDSLAPFVKDATASATHANMVVPVSKKMGPMCVCVLTEGEASTVVTVRFKFLQMTTCKKLRLKTTQIAPFVKK